MRTYTIILALVAAVTLTGCEASTAPSSNMPIPIDPVVVTSEDGDVTIEVYAARPEPGGTFSKGDDVALRARVTNRSDKELNLHLTVVSDPSENPGEPGWDHPLFQCCSVVPAGAVDDEELFGNKVFNDDQLQDIPYIRFVGKYDEQGPWEFIFSPDFQLDWKAR